MKALSVNATPKMIELAKHLEGDANSFRDLEWQNQVLLAESGLNLGGLATKDELRNYEIEKMIRESNNPLERVKAEVIKQIEGI